MNCVTWQTKTLGSLFDIYTGNSINETVKKEKYSNLNSGYNYIATKDIDFDSTINYENGIKIPFEEKNFKIAPANTPLLCIEGGSAGRKIGFTNQAVCFVNKLCAFAQKSNDISTKFLYYFLQSSNFKKAFCDNKTGLIGGVSISKLKQLEISFPNLKEQERIVGILDEVFAGIDVLRQNAVSNLDNAKELFDSYLDQTFTQNTETWQLQPLKNLASIKDGDWIEKKDQSPSGIRLIQTGNVGNGFFKDKFENARYISENTFKELNCTEIFPDDCLISRLPDPVGRACIVPNLNTKMITAVDCSIVKFDLSKINPKFFIYYAMSAKYYAKIKSLTTGSTRERISRKNLETITIPLPNLKAQEQIVSNLNIIHEQSKELQSVYERKITLLDELKQSLLQKAFRGEL